jgi:folate-binding protein YgfZ
MSDLQILASVPDSVLSDGRILLADLDHLAVLQAAGADTVEFLHGQLTQDVKSLGGHDARLAGYCTAKGRLLASAIVWKSAAADTPALSLLVDAAVAPSLQKRLTMFVLRSKVKFAALPLHVIGVTAGPQALEALQAALGPLSAEPWSRTETASGTWIAAPRVNDVARWWWLADEQQLSAAVSTLSPFASRVAADDWKAADVEAGLPWISVSTQDLFVPQTVNLELVGGVSFTKGCYPGQEVVARSHYLGKLKRRMFAGHAGGDLDAAALPATDIYHSEDPSQPSGRVVNAARTAHGVAMLFESTLASVKSGTLHLGAADGPLVALQALPYPLDDKQD